jgi:hypothetical protein
MIKPKVGQCYYAPRGRAFRIYRYIHVNESCTMAEPVDDEPLYSNREEARRRVYELNGWNFNKKQDAHAERSSSR